MRVDSVEELLQHVRTVPTPPEAFLQLLLMRPHAQRKAGGWQDSKQGPQNPAGASERGSREDEADERAD